MSVLRNVIMFARATYFLAGVAGLSMYIMAVAILGVNLNISAVGMVFFGILAVYALNRYVEWEADMSSKTQERVYFIVYNRRLVQFIIFLYFFVAMISGILLSVSIIPYVLALIGMAYMYSHPKGLYLKRYFLAKNVLPSLGVAAVIALPFIIPSAELGPETYAGLLAVTGFVFIKMFLNTIFYDLKDIENDSKNGVRTLPVTLGERSTIIVLVAGHIVYTVLSVLLTPSFSWSARFIGVVLASAFYDIAYIFMYIRGERRLVFEVIGDGEFVFYAIVASILKWLGV